MEQQCESHNCTRKATHVAENNTLPEPHQRKVCQVCLPTFKNKRHGKSREATFTITPLK